MNLSVSEYIERMDKLWADSHALATEIKDTIEQAMAGNRDKLVAHAVVSDRSETLLGNMRAIAMLKRETGQDREDDEKCRYCGHGFNDPARRHSVCGLE